MKKNKVAFTAALTVLVGAALAARVERRLAKAESGEGSDFGERGAVWTYLATDLPFGTWTERILPGFSSEV